MADRAGEPKSYVFSDKENILEKITIFVLFFLPAPRTLLWSAFQRLRVLPFAPGRNFVSTYMFKKFPTFIFLKFLWFFSDFFIGNLSEKIWKKSKFSNIFSDFFDKLSIKIMKKSEKKSQNFQKYFFDRSKKYFLKKLRKKVPYPSFPLYIRTSRSNTAWIWIDWDLAATVPNEIAIKLTLKNVP